MTTDQSVICPRGYDPAFWRSKPEWRATGKDPFLLPNLPDNKTDWDSIATHFDDLSWWIFGNDDTKRGWCYHEMAQHLVHNLDFADRGRPLIPNEAELTKAIMACKAIGQIAGPTVVSCLPGPKATLPRHSMLHVFAVLPTKFSEASLEVFERMVAMGYVARPETKTVKVDIPPSRTAIAPDLRADVWDKSRGFCWYCGGELHPFRNFHVDHVNPVIDGGRNDLDNLVPCCTSCNSRKGSRPAEYLRKFIGSGVFWGERS